MGGTNGPWACLSGCMNAKIRLCSVLLVCAGFGAAAFSQSTPSDRPADSNPPPPPPEQVPPPPSAPPPTTPPAAPLDSNHAASANVYFYPKQGQTREQQDRDRYECYLWARSQTGYDPSVLRTDVQSNVRVVAVPGPGHDAASGAFTGAVIGAVVSRPREAGVGALIGAAAGAVFGAASDASRQKRANDEQARLDRAEAQSAARAESNVQSYQRAMKACLSGRGYSVE
jgi:outer membrane lipoprotein SlyB